MVALLRRSTLKAMSKPDPKRAVEVYFDGGCPVCSREIAFYQARMADSAINWRNVVADDTLEPDLTRDEAMARFHIRQPDGTLVSGARAFLALWRNDRRLGLLARVLDRQPLLWLLDLGYVGFLKARQVWR